MGPTFTAGIEALIGGSVMTGLVYVFYYRPSVQNEKKQAQILVDTAKLEVRSEILNLKEKLETEYRVREHSLDRMEERLCGREDALESRREALELREQRLHTELMKVGDDRSELARKHAEAQAELQRTAGLSPEQARETLLKQVESEFRSALARRAEEVERQILGDAEKQAKKVILNVIQRHAADFVSDSSLVVIDLPTEEMKGRIIGRDGRNIRAFEQIAGVDVIIDDTPEAVSISSFDPVRREVARIALMNLMVDGRIHPARIEELHEDARAEVERIILEAGERAAERANVTGLPPKVIEIMGRLRFRTSLAQNVLDHSVEVAQFAASLAAELGFNVEVAKRAGFLHDIGKALDSEWEGPHAITGMNFLKDSGESKAVLNAVGAHHHDIEPESAEAVAVIIADTLSASRPGARRDNIENHIKRLTTLEALANSFEGVERSFAIRAGREVRLIVRPEVIDDLAAKRLANDMARRIEGELDFAGQVKVTVIRELRVSDVAR